MPRRKIEVVIAPEDDPDFLMCMDYLKCVEYDGQKIQDFAASKNIDRVTLWRYITKWKKSGLIQNCRSTMAHFLFDDVIVANRRAALEWKSILNELVDIAKNSKSDYVRVQAAFGLWEKIIKPLMDEQEDPGHDERSYLDMISSNSRALDPLSVVEEEPLP